MMGLVSRIRQPKILPASLRLVGAAAVATMFVSGCSGVSAGEAAIIEGQVIGVNELQETTDQLNTVTGEPTTPSMVLGQLALSSLVDPAFAGSPAELTDGQVTDVLVTNGLETPTELTVQAARVQQYLTILQDPEAMKDPAMADATEALGAYTQDDFEALDVEISPRYGTFDPTQLAIVPSTPEWITPAG